MRNKNTVVFIFTDSYKPVAENIVGALEKTQKRPRIRLKEPLIVFSVAARRVVKAPLSVKKNWEIFFTDIRRRHSLPIRRTLCMRTIK